MTAASVVQMPAPKRRIGRLRLTEAAVRDLPLQGTEKYPPIFYDEDLRGFYVLCHRSSKSYYVQHDIAGKSVAVLIGRIGEMTPTEARKKAGRVIQQMRDGINPNEQKRQRGLDALAKAETDSFTLSDAVTFYLKESKRKRERSPKTEAEYQRIFDTSLKPYMAKSLVWLGQNQHVIEELHDAITRNGFDSESRKGRGRKKRRPAPYSANGMFRAYRAVFNFARKKKKHLKLPELDAIELNPEERKDCSMTLDQLPAWYAQVQAMHPIHRDVNLFALFTGNRSTAARQTRWEDVDLTGAVNGVPSVFVPTPKGGRTKAFFVPLSKYLVDLLKARRACKITRSDFGAENPWVFPSPDSESGYLEDPTEVIFKDAIRVKDGTPKDDNISPHDLRHTFSTCAHFAGVNATDIAFLMNHRPKSITVGYMKALLPQLRDCQEQISKYIKKHLTKNGK